MSKLMTFMKKLHLDSLGLSENESKAYMAILSIGVCSVKQISESTGIKRSSVYSYVHSLLEKGFIEKVPSGKKTYLKVKDPSLLVQKARIQMESLESALPELVELYQNVREQPKVTILQGEEGIFQIYEEAKVANSVCVFSNITKEHQGFYPGWVDMATVMAEKKTNVREIISNSRQANKIAQTMKKIIGSSYRVRISNDSNITNDNLVYGNVVAFMSLHKHELFVVRIEDRFIAENMRTLFNLAWKSAKILF